MWPRAQGSFRHFLGTDQARRHRGSFFEAATAASGDVSRVDVAVEAGKSHLTFNIVQGKGEKKQATLPGGGGGFKLQRISVDVSCSKQQTVICEPFIIHSLKEILKL